MLIYAPASIFWHVNFRLVFAVFMKNFAYEVTDKEKLVGKINHTKPKIFFVFKP